jgi:hypothetical protein
MQQLPGLHVPPQHSSAALSGQTALLWLVVQPAALAKTQEPRAAPLAVTQIWEVGHCPSLVQPPQKFGLAKPHVGVGAAQAAFAVQLPSAQEPAMHT